MNLTQDSGILPVDLPFLLLPTTQPRRRWKAELLPYLGSEFSHVTQNLSKASTQEAISDFLASQIIAQTFFLPLASQGRSWARGVYVRMVFFNTQASNTLQRERTNCWLPNCDILTLVGAVKNKSWDLHWAREKPFHLTTSSSSALLTSEKVKARARKGRKNRVIPLNFKSCQGT